MTARARFPLILAVLLTGALPLVALLASTSAPGEPPAARPTAENPDSWDTIDVDPLDYFTAEELETWRSFRDRGRARSLARLFLSLGLYAVFALTLVGRATYSLAWAVTSHLGGLAPLRSGAARRLSAVLSRVFGDDWAAALLFTWLFLFAVAAAALPLRFMGELDARAAGLSVYTNPAWLWDVVKGLLLNAASMTFLVFGLFGLIRKMPRRWWLALGGPAAVVMVVWGIASPYQARLFYDFTELEEGPLRTRFETLAEKKDITLTAVRVIDASRHTRGINAYVTGLGPSRELVLFDTTIDLLGEDELAAVLAHELGHVDRERPVLRYFLSAVVMLLILWLLSLLLRVAPRRLGLEGPGDPRALPLILLVVTVGFLVVRPVQRAWSRHEERLADRAGLVLTQNPQAFIDLKVELARQNRADVDPPGWVIFWFATHPPIIERIGMARWYESWLEERTPHSDAPKARQPPGDTE